MVHSGRVSNHNFAQVVVIDSPICASFAITFLVVASAGLRTNTNTVTDLDTSGNVLAYSDGLTNDFVADTYRIFCWEPS